MVFFLSTIQTFFNGFHLDPPEPELKKQQTRLSLPNFNTYTSNLTNETTLILNYQFPPLFVAIYQPNMNVEYTVSGTVNVIRTLSAITSLQELSAATQIFLGGCLNTNQRLSI